MKDQKKHHWEEIYTSRQTHEVSWTQEVPATSLGFIRSFNLPKSARIIDIGGGDSRLVDHLLDRGYRNISVLDISARALERAKKRLGEKASMVKWIVSDINQFEPENTFDIWHDRATFHFLIKQEEIQRYLHTARKAVEGYLTIGTFSESGPQKCSGLPVKQYSEGSLQQELSNGFRKIRCIREDHITPFQTQQNFLFCSFKRSS